ncbi:hypothetical protein [Halomontanus rarus]|uniref:hypothetical protein n=1 Tax=Halomontanus rarus TaxID=3034020 RepID=UPI0023E89E00|nr:hypothetical protein [Halovivax sp. TS33]
MKTSHTYRLLLAAVFAVALVSGAIAAPVAAQDNETDTNPLDEILSDEDVPEEEQGLADKAKSYVPDYLVDGMALFDGQLQRWYASLAAKSPLAEDPATNAELATEFDRTVENRNETFLEFSNNETSPSVSHDTHLVTFDHEESASATVYVAAPLENETYQRLTVMSEQEFADSGHDSPDAEWVIDGDGALDTSELIDGLADRIEDDKPIDRTKQAQLIGRYCGADNPFGDSSAGASCDIRSSLWLEDDELYQEDS